MQMSRVFCDLHIQGSALFLVAIDEAAADRLRLQFDALP